MRSEPDPGARISVTEDLAPAAGFIGTDIAYEDDVRRRGAVSLAGAPAAIGTGFE